MGQDKFLDRFVFQGLKHGIFIDVGAHDGKSLSNTYFFEKDRDWRGLCIEPISSVFEKCKAIRDKSICYKLAIDREVGMKHFILGSGNTEMLSVLIDHLDPRHYQRLQNDSSEAGVPLLSVAVETVPLQNLLDNNQITHVNYMSIDVEGAEFAVLESIDFTKTTFDIIEVECNYDDLKPRFDSFFQEKGFVKLLNLDWDMLYIHKQSKFFPIFQNENLPFHLSIFQPPWKDWRDL